MDVLNKLFPPPTAGTQRQIPSRHAVQVALMIALIISSIFQIFQGVAVGGVAVTMSPTILATALVATVIGCLLCLSSAIFAERKPWDSIGLSMGGFFILTCVMIFSCFFYVDVHPEYWLRRDFWVTIALTGGFAWRFAQLLVDAIRIKKGADKNRRRAS